MRQVAQYVFSASHQNPEINTERYGAAVDLVDGWATQKGWREIPNFTLPDGRAGQFDSKVVQSNAGSLKRWTLLEEIPGGFFETNVGLALTNDRIHASCSLAVGHNTNQLSPLRYEARCPSVLRLLLDRPWNWRLGKSSISTAPLPFRGKAGGQSFVALLKDVERSLPVVALSSHYGLLIHREIDTRMARDLVALATVVVLDEEAAWEATLSVGRNWSCYNGAIRLYWPGLRVDGNPMNHPLWTSERLLDGTGTVDQAERRIRETLRKRLMSVSVPALVESKAFVEITRAFDEAQNQQRMEEAIAASDHLAIADIAVQENDKLSKKVRELEEHLGNLRKQLYRFQVEDVWADAEGTVEPDADEPADSVEEAVSRARTLYAGQLRFGEDVEDGVRGVSSAAGPPDKIFGYLRTLAEMVTARRNGSLGDSMLGWLSAKNVACSDESYTILNDRSEMKRRTWDDGGDRREFSFHLKPSEATHPDRCVRIYFAWDEASDQVIVGWVGRHP